MQCMPVLQTAALAPLFLVSILSKQQSHSMLVLGGVSDAAEDAAGHLPLQASVGLAMH